MATTTPPVADSSSPQARTFGARPFHTDGDLLALGFASDGGLWSVEEPGVLRRWDVGTRQQLDWHGLEELATLWGFSPDAALVAAGSDELSVWESATGALRASWPQPSWVTAVAFQPGGGLLATGHDDGVVRLWDVARQEVVRELKGHGRPVSALAFRGDGRRLASAGEDRVIRLWDVDGGSAVGSLLGHHDRIPALAWHPNGRRLLSAGWDTTARVWDVETGEPIILLNSHAGQVQAVAVSPDGKLVACADSANAVHLWDAEHYRTLQVLRRHAGEVRCLAFSPDGQVLAFGGAERVIHLWDARRGDDGGEAIDPLLSRTGLAVGPGGRLSSLGAGTALRVWDTATGGAAAGLEGAGALRAFAASPDGRWFAAGRADEAADARNTLGLWEAATGRFRCALEGQPAPITALAFSADSATLAAGGYQSSDVWLWDVARAEPALLVPDAAEGCSVEALAFAPGGRLLAVGGIDYLATSGLDGRVVLWDVHARKPAAALHGGAAGLSFHPSGKWLASASLVQSVRVWDVEGGRLVAELLGHLDAVTCVAYSPDGHWLASGSDDRTVRLWDSDGVQRGMTELDTQVKALAFSPDGRHLFTGNGNGSCYQFEVRQLLTEGG
ncbi:MAG TPA: WD40 repeat domain-containing protein [Gemmataceae bacterium]|nr:WD40 repeat domain-containing protein [Gemmataceae bacterium]